jgi:predicted Holliday junction resolvase-like endonuclease
MKILLIWIVWLALVFYWLSPEVESVRNKVTEHNKQIQKALEE